MDEMITIDWVEDERAEQEAAVWFATHLYGRKGKAVNWTANFVISVLAFFGLYTIAHWTNSQFGNPINEYLVILATYLVSVSVKPALRKAFFNHANTLGTDADSVSIVYYVDKYSITMRDGNRDWKTIWTGVSNIETSKYGLFFATRRLTFYIPIASWADHETYGKDAAQIIAWWQAALQNSGTQ